MPTLLIVDDEPEILDIVEDVFDEQEGFSVLRADNGPDGIELVKAQRPDIILLDVKLQANMDGLEVLKQIKVEHPSAKVIVITGYVEEKMERDIRDLGINAYIEKPFTPPQILEAVQSVLQKNRSEHG